MSVFFFAKVITFSASRWASFAFGHVVEMDSWVKREVTRLRSKACRWDDFRPRCRYFRAPPAIAGKKGAPFFLSLSFLFFLYFLSFSRSTAVLIRLRGYVRERSGEYYSVCRD